MIDVYLGCVAFGATLLVASLVLGGHGHGGGGHHVDHGELGGSLAPVTSLRFWVFLLAFVGKQAGDNWSQWKDHLHYVDYAVVAAVILGVVWLVARRLTRRRRAGADATA